MNDKQAYALGNVLYNLSTPELVKLNNEFLDIADKIFSVKGINEDFAEIDLLKLIKATKQNNFKESYDYFRLGEEWDALECNTYIIFKSVDKYDIEVEDIAKKMFDGRKLPDNVNRLIEDKDIMGDYLWYFADYIKSQSGATNEQVMRFIEGKEGRAIREDWFNLYCEFRDCR